MERYKVKESSQIVRPLHNKEGSLIDSKEVTPPSGPKYVMLRVELDAPVDVGGGIKLQILNLPIECFEKIS